MKKLICLALVLALALGGCSSPAESESASTGSGDASTAENLLSDEEALKIERALTEKYVTFCCYIMEMAEFGRFNIDGLETFEEDGALYAEYVFDNFLEYESTLEANREWEEAFDFSSIDEINAEILSIFVSLEASCYSDYINGIFKERDQKLFYNTNEESAIFSYFWDYQNAEIVEKTETRIFFSVYSDLLDKTETFSMVKNSDGEWRLSEDIRKI